MSLLTPLALILSTNFSYASLANLGPADVSKPTEQASNQTEFDAWCIKKYANCVVRLKNKILSVDDSSGIKRNQIIKWSRTQEFRHPEGLVNFIGPHNLYKYTFKYRNKNNEIKEAIIIFQNDKYSDKFYSLIKSWSPNKESRCKYDFETRKVKC